MRLNRGAATLLAVLVVLPLGAAAGTQAGDGEASGLATVTYTLRHQPVGEAIGLVFPFLSEKGSVEVRPGGNALRIRDTPEALARILPVLRDFDQPGRPVRLEIRIVSAASDPANGGDDSGLPEDLVARLRELLRFRSYRKIAAADLDVAEGEGVGRELGDEFRVEFRVGRLLADRRIKLQGFRVWRLRRSQETAPLIHTNVNLRLDQPMVLGLARTEASERALMVVLRCALAGDGAGS